MVKSGHKRETELVTSAGLPALATVGQMQRSWRRPARAGILCFVSISSSTAAVFLSSTPSSSWSTLPLPGVLQTSREQL